MKSGGAVTAHPSTVEIVNGPVPADHPSHKLRLAAAKDLVERCKRQLADAEADLARLIKEQKGN
jgi:hypothetical protein